MQSILPLEERPEEPVGRSWPAFAASGLVHALLMIWLIFRPVPAGTSEPKPTESGQAAQPIALPRPQEAAPTSAPSRPAQVQPPPRETPLGPDSKRPDARVPQEAGPPKPLTEPDPTPVKSQADPAPSAEQPPEPAPADPTPPPPQQQAVKRIPLAREYASSGRLAGTPTSPWGPPSATPLEPGKSSASGAPAAPAAAAVGSMGRIGQSGRDARDWRPSFPEAAGRCATIPDLGNNADGTPVLATVIGRVFDTDGRTPLSGAHLQIMGTPFATFSDADGEYRLEFDPKLLEKCRVQYVRVVADGYSGQLLTLAIGERVRSDDVILKKH